MVRDILLDADLHAGDLNAVAISAGPGSYTGLRIGASLAKALCFAQNIPLISVNSLLAISEAVKEKYPNAKRIISLVDARRMDVYCGLLHGTEFRESFMTLEPDSFTPVLEQGEWYFGGTGQIKCADLIDHPHAHYTPVEHIHARHLVPIAQEKWSNGDFEDLVTYEPHYIKAVHVTTPRRPFS